jgi:hypothetical protein
MRIAGNVDHSHETERDERRRVHVRGYRRTMHRLSRAEIITVVHADPSRGVIVSNRPLAHGRRRARRAFVTTSRRIGST